MQVAADAEFKFMVVMGSAFVLFIVAYASIHIGRATSDNVRDYGSLREPCYPNATCESVWTCVSDVCVKLPTPDAGIVD